MKFVRSCTVFKYTYYKITIENKSISIRGENICKEIQKDKKIYAVWIKKLTLFSHSFVENIIDDIRKYW